ncbi:MAG: IS30 family transposase [Solirubrobacteraceae bacterium]
MSPVEAAASVALSAKRARGLFKRRGGVIPGFVYRRSSGRYLCLEERMLILVGVERGESLRAIARTLGRAPSTVLREVRRNMRHHYRVRRILSRQTHGRRRVRPWDYQPWVAQLRAELGLQRPKERKLALSPQLHALVESKLEWRLSPRQISVQLRLEFPDRPEMWVSHETIYQALYVQGRGALRRELAARLRSGRSLRKPHRTTPERRGRLPDMLHISLRPAEAEDRAVPGHWEGDLILGADGKSAIGTLVERSTRYLILLHLPQGHGAEEVAKAMIEATKKLPQSLWKTLTWDQGSEMAHHLKISVATGLEIYFCDPASPWQRGSNENTNGLLRQYFPKGTDLSVHTAEDLEFVSLQMNTRPRETLGWRQPRQALDELLATA